MLDHPLPNFGCISDWKHLFLAVMTCTGARRLAMMLIRSPDVFGGVTADNFPSDHSILGDVGLGLVDEGLG